MLMPSSLLSTQKLCSDVKGTAPLCAPVCMCALNSRVNGHTVGHGINCLLLGNDDQNRFELIVQRDKTHGC